MIGGCHHKHRAPQPLRAQILIHELHNLAAAFAHQRDHVDVRLDVARDHAHQRALAHAAARENAHALALADGEHAVDDAHAHLDHLADGRAVHWVCVVAVDGIAHARRQRRAAVDGIAQRVDGAADECVAQRNGELLAGVRYHAARADAVHILIGHQHRNLVADADHLGQNRLAGGQADLADIAHIARNARGLQRHAHTGADLAFIRIQVAHAQHAPQPGGVVCLLHCSVSL